MSNLNDQDKTGKGSKNKEREAKKEESADAA